MNIGPRMRAFWQEIGLVRPVVPDAQYSPQLPDDDCPETIGPDLEADAPPEFEAGSIAGRTVVIAYRDGKGQASERQVVCRRLERNGDQLYLVAWCVLRSRVRNFRADRVLQVIDPLTGEVHEPGAAFLDAFAPDRESASAFHYGLSVPQYAAFNAALNVLAFMARCDGKWHPLEADAIEAFATSFWLRAEIAAPLDLREINRHAERLAPDPEVFWASLIACGRHPVLAHTIRRHIAAVIDTDGYHHPLEIAWGRQVDEFLAEAG